MVLSSWFVIEELQTGRLIPRSDTAISPLEQALLTYFPPLFIRNRSLTIDFRENFHEVVRNSQSKTAQLALDFTSQRLRTQLENKPKLWDKLTPKYAPGSKRLNLTDDYYPAHSRENVDLDTKHILRIMETGIIVEAGFKTVEFMGPIKFHGSNGRPLTDIWRHGASANCGLTVEDLPSFGIFYGPNATLGYSSVILRIEAQSRYLNALVAKVLKARTQGKTL
ncbi:hypothetical protein BDW75DRAFT_243149 [Aspergillus navahoensis]